MTHTPPSLTPEHWELLNEGKPEDCAFAQFPEPEMVECIVCQGRGYFFVDGWINCSGCDGAGETEVKP